jgi:hypothetical protein
MTNYVPDSINITLRPGWNWIGFINTEDKYIGDIITNGKKGYSIKSKEQSPVATEYYDVAGFNGWIPDDFVIKPGTGYEFYLDPNEFSENEVITITR